MSRFQKIAAGPETKKPRSAPFFENRKKNGAERSSCGNN